MRSLDPIARALLVLALVTPAVPAQVDVEAVRERVPEILETLADVGYDLEQESVAVEVTSTEEAGSYFIQQQDLMFADGHFAGMTYLRFALHGLPSLGLESIDEVPEEMIAAPVVAYYDMERAALVLVDGRWSELATHDGTLAHELAHAIRDETHPFLEFLEPARESVDAAQVRQCVIEGDAELARIAFLNRLQGRRLNDVSEEEYDLSSARSKWNESRLAIYEAGGRLALRHFTAGGLEAIDRLFESPPASTEQVLHPEKAEDVPTPLSLPETPLEVVYETTVGELMIRGILRTLSDSVLEGTRAAMGWDGDTLRVLRSPDGSLAIQWRTLWDRELDARQFAGLIGSHQEGTGVLRRHGRLVDWIAADDAELREQLAATLVDARPELTPDEHDAHSAEAVEARFDATPFVDTRHWLHPGIGLRIPVPDNCTPRFSQGTHILAWPPVDNFVDNVAVMGRLAKKEPVSTEQIATRVGEYYDEHPSFELIAAGTRETLQGLTIADVTFSNTEDETGRVLVIPDGDHSIWVVITVRTERVEQRRDDVEALIDGILLDD